MRFRFTIRDLLWLTLVVALIIGWFIDQRRHAQMALENQLLKRDEQVIERAQAELIWTHARYCSRWAGLDENRCGGRFARLIGYDGGMSQQCPVCSLPLDFEPWTDGAGCQEICPRCGIHFGYNDAAGGDESKRAAIYSEWRNRWVAAECPEEFSRLD